MLLDITTIMIPRDKHFIHSINTLFIFTPLSVLYFIDISCFPERFLSGREVNNHRLNSLHRTFFSPERYGHSERSASISYYIQEPLPMAATRFLM